MTAKAEELAARVRKGEASRPSAAGAGRGTSARPTGVAPRRRQALADAPGGAGRCSAPSAARVVVAATTSSAWWSPSSTASCAGDPDRAGPRGRGQRATPAQRPVPRAWATAARNAARDRIKLKIDYARARTALGLEPDRRRPQAAPAARRAKRPSVSAEPAFEAFAAGLRRRRAPGRLDAGWSTTWRPRSPPILKIGHGRPYAFLFESVEGGAWRGRYSIIALKPDLVWRCRGDKAEIAEGDDIAAGRFTPAGRRRAGHRLRDLVAASAVDLPRRPAADGRRRVRRPGLRHDPAGRAPARRQSRPAGPARRGDDPARRSWRSSTPSPRRSSWSRRCGPGRRPARDGLCRRRRRAWPRREADLRAPLPRRGPGRSAEPEPPASTPVSRAGLSAASSTRPRTTSRAGDIFQVVPSHRFRAPFDRRPVRPLPLAAAHQPLAVPVLS